MVKINCGGGKPSLFAWRNHMQIVILALIALLLSMAGTWAAISAAKDYMKGWDNDEDWS